MLRQLTAATLAAALAVGAAAAQADDWKHRGRGHPPGHDFRPDHPGKGKHHWRHEYRDRRDHWDRRDRWDRWDRRGLRFGDFPDSLGEALIGAAVSFALYHNHDGRPCYDRHHWRGRYSRVGCHRIEYLGNGVQRRRDVPLSACR